MKAWPRRTIFHKKKSQPLTIQQVQESFDQARRNIGEPGVQHLDQPSTSSFLYKSGANIAKMDKLLRNKAIQAGFAFTSTLPLLYTQHFIAAGVLAYLGIIFIGTRYAVLRMKIRTVLEVSMPTKDKFELSTAGGQKFTCLPGQLSILHMHSSAQHRQGIIWFNLEDKQLSLQLQPSNLNSAYQLIQQCIKQ